MFEIIGLVVAVTGIVALARGRGASPVVVGTIAVAGWALIEYGGLVLLPCGKGPYVLMLIAWAWIGMVGSMCGSSSAPAGPSLTASGTARIADTSTMLVPSICEACQQPWQQA